MPSYWAVPRHLERDVERVARHVYAQTRSTLWSTWQRGGDLDKAALAVSRAALPLARVTAKRNIAAVSAWNVRAWREVLRHGPVTDAPSRGQRAKWARFARWLSGALAGEIEFTAAGKVALELVAEQAHLISRVPLDVAESMQALAREAQVKGWRADEIEQAIQDKLGEGEEWRAPMIARTEIAKANSSLIEARATAADLEEYEWNTMEDEKVRESHAELDGQVFRFDSPPEVEGEGAHGPGMFPNCRCYPRPIILFN